MEQIPHKSSYYKTMEQIPDKSSYYRTMVHNLLKNNLLLTRIITFFYIKYHLMKTIQLKTVMTICFGHMTILDQSESFKTN